MIDNTLKVGQRIRCSGYLAHVVVIFDDDGKDHAVLKRWSNEKQRWRYTVEPVWLIVEMARKLS